MKQKIRKYFKDLIERNNSIKQLTFTIMTAQASDSITYNNKTTGMRTEPLRDYIPQLNLPHLFVATSSFCWRGYFAKWAVDNNKLFLIGFNGQILDNIKVGMDYIFPGEDVVFAHWFSGKIRTPLGEMIAYVHGGYESAHEGNQYLTFEKGNLIDVHEKWLTPEEIEKLQNVQEDYF